MKDFSKLIVLVIDDEATYRRQHISILLSMGFVAGNIIEASSANNAREKMKEGQPPDFILTDNKMPGGDALFMLQYMYPYWQVRFGSIPAVMVTSDPEGFLTGPVERKSQLKGQVLLDDDILKAVVAKSDGNTEKIEAIKQAIRQALA